MPSRSTAFLCIWILSFGLSSGAEAEVFCASAVAGGEAVRVTTSSGVLEGKSGLLSLRFEGPDALTRAQSIGAAFSVLESMATALVNGANGYVRSDVRAPRATLENDGGGSSLRLTGLEPAAFASLQTVSRAVRAGAGAGRVARAYAAALRQFIFNVEVVSRTHPRFAIHLTDVSVNEAMRLISAIEAGQLDRLPSVVGMIGTPGLPFRLSADRVFVNPSNPTDLWLLDPVDLPGRRSAIRGTLQAREGEPGTGAAESESALDARATVPARFFEMMGREAQRFHRLVEPLPTVVRSIAELSDLSGIAIAEAYRTRARRVLHVASESGGQMTVRLLAGALSRTSGPVLPVLEVTIDGRSFTISPETTFVYISRRGVAFFLQESP